jgi:hypothetical protein
VRQVHNGQMWGRLTLNNAVLAVKAKHGLLPDDVDGVEFETNAAPTPGCSTRSEVFWYVDQDTPNVHVAEEDGEEYCYIEVAIRKGFTATYTRQATTNSEVVPMHPLRKQGARDCWQTQEQADCSVPSDVRT